MSHILAEQKETPMPATPPPRDPDALDDPETAARDAAFERRKAERKAWYEEGMRAWRHYQETGLHVTWAELEAWLETCGTDHEIEPPECHR